MKNITESLNESIANEARMINYRASVMAMDGTEIILSVDAKCKKQMEEWLDDMVGNVFMHANCTDGSYEA